MKIIEVIGNQTLSGQIRIGGAKNSAVALIPACILGSDDITLTNVPDITDIDVLCKTLEYLGVSVKRASQSLVINSSNMENKNIPQELSGKLRASYYFMSSLLAKYKHVEMHFPGGCSIGSRPIDQTLKVYRALGATVKEEGDLFTIDANELVGSHIELDMPSVGATVNALIVSCIAKGETIITNAAKEPEISDLIDMLNSMGANIKGAGTSTLTIDGVEVLGGCCHNVIPDRIEAGTYVILGCLVGNYLTIDNINPDHIKSLTDKLYEMGCDLEINSDNIVVNKSENYKSINIETKGYPGYATDLQQPLVALLTQCNGISKVNETIYENRYMNVPELNKMGANITVDGRIATINGKTPLKGCEVNATDLRGGACLLLAGLTAEGKTTIRNAHYILRGYEEIAEKLANCGAKINILEVAD